MLVTKIITVLMVIMCSSEKTPYLYPACLLSPPLCSSNTQPMLCNNLTIFSINDGTAKLIASLHNVYRKKLTTGEEFELQLSSASNMKAVKWDAKLEGLAKSFIRKCNADRKCSACHSTGTFENLVGENVIFSSEFDPKAGIRWSSNIGYWRKNGIANASKALSSGYRPDLLPNASYSNMIWANTYKIGCAEGTFQNSQYSTVNYLAVCYYNNVGQQFQRIYEKGPPCSLCPTNFPCSPTLVGLCEEPNTTPTISSTAYSEISDNVIKTSNYDLPRLSQPLITSTEAIGSPSHQLILSFESTAHTKRNEEPSSHVVSMPHSKHTISSKTYSQISDNAFKTSNYDLTTLSQSLITSTETIGSPSNALLPSFQSTEYARRNEEPSSHLVSMTYQNVNFSTAIYELKTHGVTYIVTERDVTSDQGITPTQNFEITMTSSEIINSNSLISMKPGPPTYPNLMTPRNSFHDLEFTITDFPARHSHLEFEMSSSSSLDSQRELIEPTSLWSTESPKLTTSQVTQSVYVTQELPLLYIGLPRGIQSNEFYASIAQPAEKPVISATQISSEISLGKPTNPATMVPPQPTANNSVYYYFSYIRNNPTTLNDLSTFPLDETSNIADANIITNTLVSTETSLPYFPKGTKLSETSTDLVPEMLLSSLLPSSEVTGTTSPHPYEDSSFMISLVSTDHVSRSHVFASDSHDNTWNVSGFQTPAEPNTTYTISSTTYSEILDNALKTSNYVLTTLSQPLVTSTENIGSPSHQLLPSFQSTEHAKRIEESSSYVVSMQHQNVNFSIAMHELTTHEITDIVTERDVSSYQGITTTQNFETNMISSEIVSSNHLIFTEPAPPTYPNLMTSRNSYQDLEFTISGFATMHTPMEFEISSSFSLDSQRELIELTSLWSAESHKLTTTQETQSVYVTQETQPLYVTQELPLQNVASSHGIQSIEFHVSIAKPAEEPVISSTQILSEISLAKSIDPSTMVPPQPVANNSVFNYFPYIRNNLTTFTDLSIFPFDETNSIADANVITNTIVSTETSLPYLPKETKLSETSTDVVTEMLFSSLFPSSEVTDTTSPHPYEDFSFMISLSSTDHVSRSHVFASDSHDITWNVPVFLINIENEDNVTDLNMLVTQSPNIESNEPEVPNDTEESGVTTPVTFEIVNGTLAQRKFEENLKYYHDARDYLISIGFPENETDSQRYHASIASIIDGKMDRGWNSRVNKPLYKNLIKKVFKLFDIDGNKFVSETEFIDTLKKKYKSIGMTDEDALFKIRYDNLPYFFGADEDIELSFEYESGDEDYMANLYVETSLSLYEFKRMLFPFSYEPMTRTIINQLLGYDADFSYDITLDELSEMKGTEGKWSTMEKIFQQSDKNNDGRLEEFEIYLYQRKVFREQLPSASLEMFLQEVKIRKD